MEETTTPAKIPIWKRKKVLITVVSIGATALVAATVKNHLDIQKAFKANGMHASTILSILYTLEDNDIIQNLKIGE